MKRYLFALICLLAACAPRSAPTAGPETQTSPASSQVRWRANVEGPERFAGAYQGELGRAVMVGGDLLTLELGNMAYSGAGETLFDVPLESPPLSLVIQFDPPQATVLLRWSPQRGEILDPEQTFSSADLSNLELKRQGDVLSGRLRFTMTNNIGETITVTFTELALRVVE